MMRFAISIMLAICAHVLAPFSPAMACSAPPEYRVPITLQMVERADAIVLAKVEDGGPSTHGGFRKASLVPFKSLKGETLPSAIDIDYAVLSNEQMRATPSDPRNLVDANPEGFMGGCVRSTFDKGMIVLVFLRKEGRKWVPDMAAFSRALEDVPSSTALWVKTVQTYVQIASFPEAQRRKEMERQRLFLADDINDADSRLIALELDRALRTGNGKKPSLKDSGSSACPTKGYRPSKSRAGSGRGPVPPG
jgi:hypothetical protein